MHAVSSGVRPLSPRVVGVCLLATAALLCGPGCPSGPAQPVNVAPAAADPAIAGTLVQGQAGSVVVSCTATDTDGTVESVVADLSVIGGSAAQPMALAADNLWSWSGWVTPPTAGSLSVTFTATDDDTATGTAQAAVTVRATDPGTLVLDLGNTVVIELVLIPAGSFQMGTNSTDVITFYQLGVTEPVTDAAWSNAARPVHQVTFSQPFYMGKYPLTQAQWHAVMGSDPAPSIVDAERAAGNVSWNDAAAFCQALSTQTGRTARLPSEAEWEYACKAGSGDTAYFFGNDASQLGQYAWYRDNSGSPQAVGQKLPNAFGLYDVHGNVWEWCQDLWHDNYNAAPSDGSVWSVGGRALTRPLRGGSCYNNAGACRSAFRNSFPADSRYADFGLHIVVP